MTEHYKEPDILENSPWLDMPEFDWSCVTQDVPLKSYKKGEVIYHQSQPCQFVYLDQKGRVQLDLYSVNGDKRIFFIAESGALFGELSPFDGMPCLCNATAVTDCQIYCIPMQRFMDELLCNHKFSLNVLQMMTKKMRLLSTLIKQLSFNNSTYRVAYALMNLVHQYSAKTPLGYHKLNLKFTHQDLADLTGLSRVSVSNILLEMQACGIIEKEKEDGFVIIRDPELLRSFMNEYK